MQYRESDMGRVTYRGGGRQVGREGERRDCKKTDRKRKEKAGRKE